MTKALLPLILLLPLMFSCHSEKQASVKNIDHSGHVTWNDSLNLGRTQYMRESFLSLQDAVIDSPVIMIKRADSATVLIKAKKIRMSHEKESLKSIDDSLSLTAATAVRNDSVTTASEEIRPIVPRRLIYTTVIFILILTAGIWRFIKSLRR